MTTQSELSRGQMLVTRIKIATVRTLESTFRALALAFIAVTAGKSIFEISLSTIFLIVSVLTILVGSTLFIYYVLIEDPSTDLRESVALF
jgi:hypothetical protein